MQTYVNGNPHSRDHREEARAALGPYAKEYRHISPYLRGTCGKKLKKFTRGGFEFFLLEIEFMSMGLDFVMQGPFTEKKLYFQKK
jgi:hypothetical protein